MPEVRLQIGASLDPGAARILDPLLAAVKRARVQIANEMKGMSDDVARGYRDAPAYARKAFGGAADEAEKADKRVTASSARAAREREKDAEHVFQIKQRYLEQEAREAEKAARKQAEATKSILRGAAGTFVGGARGAIGVAGQIARGAGVNLDVGSLVGNISRQQQAATEISASGYLEGTKGAGGVRQDPGKILAEARAAADTARISTDVALAGLQAFVGKTTDLETGRQILEKMAIQSKATGASMEDVMDAAGSIAVKMGDIPDKANAVASLMGIIAKQGKVGAVEMRTMASQIAGFIGPANKFQEGIAGAVTELGTLFQITNKFGGVKGPAQAGTSVAAFVSDLTSKSGTKALMGAGMKPEDIFADKGKTKLRALADIIPALIEKSGGDLTRLAATMPNKRAKSVLDAFAQIYNDAEKLKKGTGRTAVQDVFKTYSGGTSQKDIQDALTRANDTTVSKVQLLNNQLERVAEEAAGKILPEFEKLAPDLVKLASGLASVAVFIAQNPLKAAFIGMGASLSKELASAGIKAAIERGITAGAGKGGMVLGAVALTAAAVTLITETMEEKAAAGEEKGAAEVDYNQKLMVTAAKELKEKGSLSQGRIAELLQARAEMETETAQGEAAKRRTRLGAAKELIFGDLTLGQMGKEREFAGQQSRIENQKMNLEAILAKAKVDPSEVGKAVAGALSKGTLKVQLVGGGMPGAPGATTGPAPIR